MTVKEIDDKISSLQSEIYTLKEQRKKAELEAEDYPAGRYLSGRYDKKRYLMHVDAAPVIDNIVQLRGYGIVQTEYTDTFNKWLSVNIPLINNNVKETIREYFFDIPQSGFKNGLNEFEKKIHKEVEFYQNR